MNLTELIVFYSYVLSDFYWNSDDYWNGKHFWNGLAEEQP